MAEPRFLIKNNNDMDIRNIILACASAVISFAACENGPVSDTDEQYVYAKRETMTLTVSAVLDPDGHAEAVAASAEEAAAAAALWQWGEGPSATLFYECDNMTAVAQSSGASVDGGTATFSFENIPVEAKAIRLEYGSELVFANVAEEIGPEVIYAVGDITADAGAREISGVRMIHQCTYFDVYMPSMIVNDTRMEVSSLTVIGTDIFGRETEDDFDIPSSTAVMWVAVNKAATDLSIVAHLPGQDFTMIELPEGTIVSKLIRVRDFNDPDECIELTVSGQLDPQSKASITAADPELSAEVGGLWEWSSEDIVYAAYSIGSYKGSCKSDSVVPDPADPSKATIHFPLVPKDAIISTLSLGSADAFGKSSTTIDRGMVYSVATGFTHSAGASSIDLATFVSKCSYLKVEAEAIDSKDVSKVTISGTGVKGPGADATLAPEWDFATQWIAVSNTASDVQVSAFNADGEFVIGSLASCGAGTCGLFKVDTASPFAVNYRTVLYSDGTLIINERSTNREANEREHGTAEFECEPFTGKNYVCTASGATQQPWYSVQSRIEAVEFGSLIQPTNIGYWFYGCANLASFDATNLDVSKCTRMDALFQQAMTASGLSVDLDLSGFDLSSLTNSKGLQNVFYKATGIHSIDVSGWVVKSGVACTNMFSVQSRTLTTIYADSKTNFGAVTTANSANMFKNDTGLSGGNGTLYNASYLTATYARLDKAGSPGYFTLKQ